jgi:hypothetical protein
MKYMLFVVADPEAEGEAPDPDVDRIEDWGDKYVASGHHLMGDRLRPTQDATTIRRRGGKLLVTDGPFAETREWIAGFDILECADLDEAIEIASKHPMSAEGRLELRPFWPFEG